MYGVFAKSPRKTLERAQNLIKRQVRAAPAQTREVLRQQGRDARALRDTANQFVQTVEDCLRRPVGEPHFAQPPGTTWAWRPPQWRAAQSPRGVVAPQPGATLGDTLKLYHDCAEAAMTLNQRRNHDAGDLAAYALVLDVLQFSGSFLSLAVDLPHRALHDMGRDDVLRIMLDFQQEKPVAFSLRLNLRIGPNTVQSTRSSMGVGTSEVDFAVSDMDLPSGTIDAAWVDLLWEHPAFNQFVVRDLTVCRYALAQF